MLSQHKWMGCCLTSQNSGKRCYHFIHFCPFEKRIGDIRHSASHVMAQAVKELFPTVKLTFGPSTENGFYYDFDYERTFTPQDLEKIEKRMSEIIDKGRAFYQERGLKRRGR